MFGRPALERRHDSAGIAASIDAELVRREHPTWARRIGLEIPDRRGRQAAPDLRPGQAAVRRAKQRPLVGAGIGTAARLDGQRLDVLVLDLLAEAPAPGLTPVRAGVDAAVQRAGHHRSVGAGGDGVHGEPRQAPVGRAEGHAAVGRHEHALAARAIDPQRVGRVDRDRPRRDGAEGVVVDELPAPSAVRRPVEGRVGHGVEQVRLARGRHERGDEAELDAGQTGASSLPRHAAVGRPPHGEPVREVEGVRRGGIDGPHEGKGVLDGQARLRPRAPAVARAVERPREDVDDARVRRRYREPPDKARVIDAVRRIRPCGAAVSGTLDAVLERRREQGRRGPRQQRERAHALEVELRPGGATVRRPVEIRVAVQIELPVRSRIHLERADRHRRQVWTGQSPPRRGAVFGHVDRADPTPVHGRRLHRIDLEDADDRGRRASALPAARLGCGRWRERQSHGAGCQHKRAAAHGGRDPRRSSGRCRLPFGVCPRGR